MIQACTTPSLIQEESSDDTFDWARQSLIAFQKLWNKAAAEAGVGNVTNFLNEEGIYDKKTDYALWSSPCNGFPHVGIEVPEDLL